MTLEYYTSIFKTCFLKKSAFKITALYLGRKYNGKHSINKATKNIKYLRINK